MGLVAAYALLALVMTRPYVNYADFASASYEGDARLIIWTLAWDNHAVLTRTPLFDANVFYPAPQPLRYTEHLFGLSLFTLPWAAAGASPVLAYNATWWLTFVLNGLAAFVLLRRFVETDLAAFAGSLAFAYSFYVMLHAHGHLQLIWIWPLPLTLLLLERWFDTPGVTRVAAWLTLVLIQALTSWYLAVMVVCANAVMALVLIVTGRGTPSALWRRRAIHLGAAAAVAVLCLYPFARHYVGIRNSDAEAAGASADVASYLVPPENTIAGRWWMTHVDRRPRWIWGEQTLFAGWTALGLAVLGLVAIGRRHHVSQRTWVFPLLVLVGFFLSLGPSPPLLGGSALAPFNWLAALPGLGGVRAPGRFALLVMLGVAGIAAVGAGTLVRNFGTRGRILVMALIPLMLLESFVVDFPGGTPMPHPVPAIYLTPEVRSARSLVSLPAYQGLPDWFRDTNYLLYSTAHWRPIMNGYGRTEPSIHAEVMRHARAFPGSVDALRALGVQYVVVHADRFPNHARDLLVAAQTHTDCRLVAQKGSDYLFEIVGD